MVVQGAQERNYWHLLAAAREALAAGDFATAERRYEQALARRTASPGRVFLTERLTDGLQRLLKRGGSGSDEGTGRWDRSHAEFRDDFMSAGEVRVREAVRLAELRPEDNAEANQPVLASALFLVARSRLFPEEPASGVVLLKGLMRTAHRTGRPFAVALLRHDLPLTAEERLWLARKSVAVLETFLDQGRFAPGTPQAHEWTEAVLRLLQPEYFGQGERLEEERAWLEARTADRLLGRAEASIALYRDYLLLQPAPSPRADEARVRLLELQANIDARHFQVPCYDAALGALQSAGLAPGSEVAGRYRTAISCLEYRRPEAATGEDSRAWAVTALTSDGSVAVVLWWGSAPRDLAYWLPGDDVSRLESFLAPCAGRVVAADPQTVAAIGGAWPERPGTWSVGEYAEVLVASAPDGPRDAAADLDRLGAAEVGAWRADWRRDLGLAELAPGEETLGPRSACGGALRAGLVLLALRTRIAAADPALRAGIGEMARRGDPASRFLYDFLVVEDTAGRAVDAAFAAWTLPLLWTRPFPVSGKAGGDAEPDAGLRPDLARDRLAIVTTGRPAPVVAAWCADQHRWRVVLDRLDRLPALLPVVHAAGGPVTVVPPGGAVHDLDAALALLEDLLPGGPAAGSAGLLPLCHWQRLVTTHNGDLLDVEMLQPRERGIRPLLDLYADLVAELPRNAPGEGAGSWAEQFAQRVRRAGCVMGLVDDLPTAPDDLDARWGVFEGSGAAWVFLDAAAVRCTVGRRPETAPAALHALLHSRGERHLALLTGAVWSRTDVEDLLAEDAAVFGPAVAVALTDLRPPPLLLADRGIAATARVLRAPALAAAVEHLDRAAADDRPRSVRPPTAGLLADFWREGARRLPGTGTGWQVDDDSGPPGAGRHGAVLCLPVLPGLEHEFPEAPAPDPEDWREKDELRRLALVAARRRAAVELAAHLSGRWDAVEVLDPRWWHLGRPAAVEGARHWTGERAAAALAPAGCRCFDLPGGGGRESAPPPARVKAVAAWLEARSEMPAVVPVSSEIHGLRLEIGRGDETGTGLLAAVEAAREAGDLDRWLLVLAGAPWVPAGAAAAAGRVPGATVWSAATASAAPGPVLWAQPADLLDPGFRAYLAASPPAAALVTDLTGWLPDGSGGARGAASALHALLALHLPAVVLQAAALPAAWSRFLVAAAGVDVVAADAATAAVPDPSAVGRVSPATLAARLRRLLRRLRPLLEERSAASGGTGPRHLVSARELASLERLGHLAGLAPELVRDGIHILRWAASLAGEPLSAADAEPEPPAAARAPGHALLVRRRFAECEAGLDELASHLDLFLPPWLGGLPAGGATVVDLAAPPVRVEPPALRRLDTFLLAADAATGLDYRAPRGVLGSSRRIARLTRPATEVRRALFARLDVFRSRLKEVMSTAVETADGFLVETGLVSLRDEEQAFLGLGAALDEWRWLGPASPGALHAVDLLTLADSATTAGEGTAWSLVGELLGAPTGDGGAAAAAPRRPGWRALWPGGARGREGGEGPAARVADLAGLADEPTFVVLRGLAGTGRLDAVLAGLAAARHRGADPGDVVVCCPDTATAARFARRAVGAGVLCDLRVPEREELPPAAPDESLADTARTDVVVMCEAQRFGAELRYRVAQAGRGRRLLMTIDPAAARETWENLFLTTPRASDVVVLAEPAGQSRRLWDATRGLVPAELRPPTATRRGPRGQVVSEYAANLDQCLARLRTALAEGLLPDRIRLTAPLVEDLEHLGAALRAEGWLAVDEEVCDSLCLPGPHELLVLAAAALVGNGGIAPVGADGSEGAASPDIPAGLPERLPGAGPEAATWLASAARDPRATTLAGLHAAAAAADVLPVLRLPAARARVRDLLAAWGERPLGDLHEVPAWHAWWRLVSADLELPAADSRRPLVLLNPVARTPGETVPGGVYLCLGSEEARQHYRVLAGITDQLLVLYQERSPLPSGSEAGE